jgi:outer membrane murein-binding lipoprotein Lpp
MINKLNIGLFVVAAGTLLTGFYQIQQSSSYNSSLNSLEGQVAKLKKDAKQQKSEIKVAKTNHSSNVDTMTQIMDKVVAAEQVIVKYNNDPKSVSRTDYRQALVTLKQYILVSSTSDGWNPAKSAWYMDPSYKLSYHLGSTMSVNSARVEFVITDKNNNIMGMVTANYNVTSNSLSSVKSYTTSAGTSSLSGGD